MERSGAARCGSRPAAPRPRPGLGRWRQLALPPPRAIPRANAPPDGARSPHPPPAPGPAGAPRPPGPQPRQVLRGDREARPGAARETAFAAPRQGRGAPPRRGCPRGAPGRGGVCFSCSTSAVVFSSTQRREATRPHAPLPPRTTQTHPPALYHVHDLKVPPNLDDCMILRRALSALTSLAGRDQLLSLSSPLP